MLIKKIPTFDFAIILADGVDTGSVRGESKVCIMRDNVLFECGLCIMALGTERVILLIEEGVRIPDDLWGIGGIGSPAIKKIEYRNKKKKYEGNLNEKLQDAVDHINEKSNDISPIVIGAAISTADGYLSNFILRFWENIGNGFNDFKTGVRIDPNVSSIRMEILIPEKIDDSIKGKTFEYYDNNGFKRGLIPDATFRGVDFRYKQTADEFIVCDIPTTLTASYTTVEDILLIHADDQEDPKAKGRFLIKERDSFIFTLNRLMKDVPMIKKLETYEIYKKDQKKVDDILAKMKKVEIKPISF